MESLEEDPDRLLRRRAVRLVFVVIFGMWGTSRTYAHSQPGDDTCWQCVWGEWFLCVVVAAGLLWWLERAPSLRPLSSEGVERGSDVLRRLKIRLLMLVAGPVFLCGDLPVETGVAILPRFVRRCLMVFPAFIGLGIYSLLSEPVLEVVGFTFPWLAIWAFLGCNLMYALSPLPLTTRFAQNVLPRGGYADAFYIGMYMLVALIPLVSHSWGIIEAFLSGQIFSHRFGSGPWLGAVELQMAYVRVILLTIMFLPYVCFCRWAADRRKPSAYLMLCVTFVGLVLCLLFGWISIFKYTVDYLVAMGTTPKRVAGVVLCLGAFVGILGLSAWAVYPPSPSRRSS